MAALLVALTIMAIFLGMALPAWRTASQREKEAELIFRGQQYARAIMLFQRKYANTFPPNVDILLNEHFLRKKYKDPITNDDFQVVYVNQQASAQPSPPGQQAGPAGTGIVPTQGQPAQRTTTVGSGTSSIGAQGGIVGVSSKSTETSIRLYNGRDKYNEWVFVAQQTSGRAGAPNGSQTPTGNPFGGAPGGQGGAAGARGGRGGPGAGGQGFPGRGDAPGGRGQGQPPFGGQRPGGPGQQGNPFGTPFGNPFGRGGAGGNGGGR